MINNPPSHGVKLALLEWQFVEGKIDRSRFLMSASGLGLSRPEKIIVTVKFLAIAANQATLRENIRADYDYIMIGSGAAGTVVAGRLCREPRRLSMMGANEMETLLQTNKDYVCTFLRLIAGIIIFPYGDAETPLAGLTVWGSRGTLQQLAGKNIPTFIAWLIIVGQSFGSLEGLIFGCLGRLAAGGLFINFTGALIVHVPDGWFMNWFGKKTDEGIEFHVYCSYHCSS